MRVLILGCGPAGLMAAHAAAWADVDFMILSKARKSYMRGAQYLHGPVPGATEPGSKFSINYDLRGDSRVYAAKVYGPTYKGSVSPEELGGHHFAWDIRQTYDWLWYTYGDLVRDQAFNDPTQIQECLDWAKADLVISTIPATLLCLEGHAFSQAKIWSSDKPIIDIPDNTVVCNGEIHTGWYRAAHIHGWHTVEWPGEVKPPISDLHEVVKPISTRCNCFPEIHRMGRYGKWTKGVLSHTAFAETLALLGEAQP